MRRVRRTLPVLAALACAFAGDAAGAAARNTPGVFDYYVLVLSWVPSYCQSEGTGAERPSMRGSAARPLPAAWAVAAI